MKKKIQKTIISIRTKRLHNAITEYFSFKYSHTGAMIPKPCHEAYEKIKDEVCNAANAEGKSCSIVPGTICLSTKTKKGFISSPMSNHEWVVEETL